MEPGVARPLKLSEWIRDKGPVWKEIVRRHGLAETHLDDVADWTFADFHWAQGYDVFSSTTKLRQAGFGEIIDSEAMFLAHLDRYREARILP
jgi:hypothetical protein